MMFGRKSAATESDPVSGDRGVEGDTHGTVIVGVLICANDAQDGRTVALVGVHRLGDEVAIPEILVQGEIEIVEIGVSAVKAGVHHGDDDPGAVVIVPGIENVQVELAGRCVVQVPLLAENVVIRDEQGPPRRGVAVRFAGGPVGANVADILSCAQRLTKKGEVAEGQPEVDRDATRGRRARTVILEIPGQYRCKCHSGSIARRRPALGALVRCRVLPVGSRAGLWFAGVCQPEDLFLGSRCLRVIRGDRIVVNLFGLKFLVISVWHRFSPTQRPRGRVSVLAGNDTR